MKTKKHRNIIDYVREELRTFDEKPFNDVDSLVLAKFSYIKLSTIVGGIDDSDEPLPLGELLRAERFPDMCQGIFNYEQNLELLFAMAASPRFRHIKVAFCCDKTDVDISEQFAAITIFLPLNAAYIAFRGTDATIAGWREDFNMMYMDEVPSQRHGLEYLERVAGLTEELGTKLILGGHSKGGNVAVYAAARCRSKVRARIEAVYDHDGPGFRASVLVDDGFDEIAPRIKKTVPGFSVIGMLMCSKSDYRVVISDERFLSQHDPYTWMVGDEDFVYAEEISIQAKLLGETARDFLEAVSDSDRKRFVDAIFDIFTATGAVMVYEITADRINSAVSMINAMKDIAPSTRRFLLQTVNVFASMAMKNMRQSEIRAYKKLMMKSMLVGKD